MIIENVVQMKTFLQFYFVNDKRMRNFVSLIFVDLASRLWFTLFLMLLWVQKQYCYNELHILIILTFICLIISSTFHASNRFDIIYHLFTILCYLYDIFYILGCFQLIDSTILKNTLIYLCMNESLYLYRLIEQQKLIYRNHSV